MEREVYLLVCLPPIVLMSTLVIRYIIRSLNETTRNVVIVFAPLFMHTILSAIPFVMSSSPLSENMGLIIQSLIISYIFSETIIQSIRIIDREINVPDILEHQYVNKVLKRSIIMSAAMAALYSFMLPFILYGLFSIYGISYSSFISVFESNGIGVILLIYILIAIEILISYYNASMLGRKHLMRHTIFFILVFLTVFSALAWLII